MEIIFQVLEKLGINFRKVNDIAGIVLTTFEFAFIEGDKIIILPDDDASSNFGKFLEAQGFIIHKIKKGDEENQLSAIFNISKEENNQADISNSQPAS